MIYTNVEANSFHLSIVPVLQYLYKWCTQHDYTTRNNLLQWRQLPMQPLAEKPSKACSTEGTGRKAYRIE